MLPEILVISFGAIFVAALRWLLTVESTGSDDSPRRKFYGQESDEYLYSINPATGLPMTGLVDVAGNLNGSSSTSENIRRSTYGIHHH
jgi:hypothetical protein